MTSRDAREGTFPDSAASVKAVSGGGGRRVGEGTGGLYDAPAPARALACTPARTLEGAPWRFASRAASAYPARDASMCVRTLCFVRHAPETERTKHR
ncbi:hypothetical protein [Sorangium sp. So ce176]|uniref:hypothetical protein n=1 Tax=Sorangium sp. So ce176 TaxID=3133286 RepID=UPI003F5D6AB0